jgi:mannose-6-phosphate isomerase
LEAELAEFKKEPTPNGLKRFYTSLITSNLDRHKRIVEDALEQARGFKSEDPVFNWMLKLAEDYPDDIGVLSPILLNLICLEPGQAMFLDAGELHAYLEGMGIELMANSDNVLRGGLTPKHVDVSELLRILKFEDRDVTLLKPVKSIANERIYPSPASEFVLSIITLKGEATYQSPKNRSVEILICTRGNLTISDFCDLTETQLPQGASAIVPACVERYSIKGEGTCYKAGVPLSVDRKRSTEVNG